MKLTHHDASKEVNDDRISSSHIQRLENNVIFNFFIMLISISRYVDN